MTNKPEHWRKNVQTKSCVKNGKILNFLRLEWSKLDNADTEYLFNLYLVNDFEPDEIFSMLYFINNVYDVRDE